MKLTLRDDTHNPHMKRRELTIDIDHAQEATPTRAALQQLAAKQFSFPVVKTDVRRIASDTGAARSLVKVFVWDEREVADLSKPKEEPNAEPSPQETETPTETSETTAEPSPDIVE